MACVKFQMFREIAQLLEAEAWNRLSEINSAKIGKRLKGPILFYLSSSFYIINQKPVIPRTDFHCISTWVAHSSG